MCVDTSTVGTQEVASVMIGVKSFAFVIIERGETQLIGNPPSQRRLGSAVVE